MDKKESIRRKRKLTKYDLLPKGTRTRLRTRDRNSCQGCGIRIRLQPHHIIPRNEGGTDDLINLILLCSQCHDCVEAHEDKPRNKVDVIGIASERTLPKLTPLEFQPYEHKDWHSWVYGGVKNPNI